MTHFSADAPAKAAFLSFETYGALCVTTFSTVRYTHLLSGGFHFILAARHTSDDVELLFSTVCQLNGSNDQTPAREALSSLHKILVTGLLNFSRSGKTSHTVGSLRTLKELLPPGQTLLAKPPSASAKSCNAIRTAWDNFLVREFGQYAHRHFITYVQS